MSSSAASTEQLLRSISAASATLAASTGKTLTTTSSAKAGRAVGRLSSARAIGVEVEALFPEGSLCKRERYVFNRVRNSVAPDPIELMLS